MSERVPVEPGKTYPTATVILSIINTKEGDFDKLIKSDVMPAEMRNELPKRINDRKRIGYTTAKKESSKSYAVVEKLGLI